MQQQEQSIETIPSPQLGAIGWDLRERQDALRREADSIDEKLLAIRGELQRRYAEMQKSAQADSDRKKQDQETLIQSVLDRVKQAPPSNGVPEPAKKEV